MLGTYVGRVSGTRLLTWGRAWLRACRLRLAWLRRTAAAMEAGVPIEPRERVLASVREVGGPRVVATGHAIYRQDGHPGSGSWSRLGWEDVDRIGWDDGARVLTLTRLRGDGPPRMVLHLPGQAPLVELAIDHSGRCAGAVRRPGLRAADRAAAARRRSREVGVHPLDPAASGDPALRARVAGAIAALEAGLGITSRLAAGQPGGWLGS